MNKQLQLLDKYSVGETVDPRARKAILNIYWRILVLVEAACFMLPSPFAIVSLYISIMTINVSIHVVPKWREVGFKRRFYFIPFGIIAFLNGYTMQYTTRIVDKLFYNFVCIFQSIYLGVAFIALIILSYATADAETMDSPFSTFIKRVMFTLTAIFFFTFAVQNPLRDEILRLIRYS